MKTRVIAVANQKGGVGKTTTALALAGGLKRRGFKVCLGDLDPQTNASFTYGAQIEDVGTMYDLLINDDIDCIQTTDLGDIIAGDKLLKDAPKLLDGVSGVHKLRKGLNAIGDRYDFIILDTPPALSVLLTNALTAADTVIVPLTPDSYGLQGLVQLMDTIQDVQEYTNPNLKVGGLLLTKYSGRTNLAKSVLDALPQYSEMFGSKVYDTKVRECIKTREAQVNKICLFEYAPDSTTAEDYDALIDELLKEDE